jgi:hypothetical protein
VPDAYPSSISDKNITEATDVIPINTRFGDVVEVDKGFLIDNYCAKFGVDTLRPTKMQPNQRQQSEEDSGKIHKIGNHRILVEQINNLAKSCNRYFRGPSPLSQAPMVSIFMRTAFFFSNFKVPFTHGITTGNTKGRHCKMAVQWAGFPSDEKTCDARARPELWMYRSQLLVYKDLSERIKAFLGDQVAYCEPTVLWGTKSNPMKLSYSPQVLTSFRLGRLTKKGMTGGEVLNVAVSEIVLGYKHEYDVRKVRKDTERRVQGDWQSFLPAPRHIVDLSLSEADDIDDDVPELCIDRLAPVLPPQQLPTSHPHPSTSPMDCMQTTRQD